MVMEPSEIGNLDFGRYAYEELLSGARKVQISAGLRKSNYWIFGCLHALQVHIYSVLSI
jgi:hypothetical protein